MSGRCLDGEGERGRRGGSWKLQDARARLSEVIRKARTEGPQRVTVRGKDALVILAADEFERLTGGPRRAGADLMAFLQTTGLAAVIPERDKDTGRDVELPW